MPPESCAKANVDDVKSFVACSTGSGDFGRWTIDDLGLPAYDYALDETRDPRALHPTTTGVPSRVHWHAFGNDRINAIFANEGWVQLFTEDRGATWLNVVDVDQHAYGGGFSFVDDGSAKWTTAHAWRPRGTITSRRFGMGYAESSASYHALRVTHRVAAPPGDATALLDDVTLENLDSSAKTFRHYEYWDVARRQLRGLWLASGVADPNLPSSIASSRDAMNAWWDETPSWDATKKILRVARVSNTEGAKHLPSPDSVSDLDAAPGDPYLAVLAGEVAEAWLDQGTFFGSGDASLPDAVRDRSHGAIGSTKSGAGEPFPFVVATDVTLAPHTSTHLRFAYGYSPNGAEPMIDPSWATLDDVRTPTTDALRTNLPYFAADRDTFLQREMAWHASQLFVATGWREYWKKHVVPQGSAYLYLHGVDGAPRDLALFSMPLVYLRPSLAKEELQMIMGVQHADDGRFSYAFHGHGFLDDAIIHTAPSDLDLFFLLAMTEYLEATGDDSILDATIDLWPKSATSSVSGFEHVKRSVRHLFDVVGTGEHGLLRVGTGDWSDGIVASDAADRDLAIKKGESVPNTQMAGYVLPRAARWIATRDATLAGEMTTKASALATAVETQWTGSFYARAFFGDGKPFGADRPQLEAQVWPLITGMSDTTKRDTLVQTIATKLDAPSPAGTFLIQPDDASPKSGQVWWAIADLLPWGYASFDEDRAWSALTKTTLNAHAEAYPDTWCGVWSATDGHWGATGGPQPGDAWSSAVTPMPDFPVQNANADAMPILALLRVAGIEPIDGGLRIAPHVPGRTFSLDTPLVAIDVRTGSIRAVYRPIVDGKRAIEIILDRPVVSATSDGTPIAVDGTNVVRFRLDMHAGVPIVLEAKS